MVKPHGNREEKGFVRACDLFLLSLTPVQAQEFLRTPRKEVSKEPISLKPELLFQLFQFLFGFVFCFFFQSVGFGLCFGFGLSF